MKNGRRSGSGRTRGGRLSEAIRNRRATQPTAHFHRNPAGRGQLAVFPRCSLLTYQFRYARRSRLEKQPTDRRRKPRYLWDRTLERLQLSFTCATVSGASSWRISVKFLPTNCCARLNKGRTGLDGSVLS